MRTTTALRISLMDQRQTSSSSSYNLHATAGVFQVTSRTLEGLHIEVFSGEL